MAGVEMCPRIKSKVDYKSRGEKSIMNFEKRLPALQSELAKQALKDPYNFDFLTIGEGYDERELQRELVDKISDFLLELGEGFAYIGKEHHLNVNGDDFYIDPLFYNLKLRSCIVAELRTEKFKPGAFRVSIFM